MVSVPSGAAAAGMLADSTANTIGARKRARPNGFMCPQAKVEVSKNGLMIAVTI
jgi:hypothetical protein